MTVDRPPGDTLSDICEDSLRLLAELSPILVPILYEVGEKTWPRAREHARKRWGVAGPAETKRVVGPRRFAVLLRKRDVATQALSWRFEAAGPVELFEWDPSGWIHGSYGVRQQVISVAPVVDENGRPSGFAINARTTTNEQGVVNAIDARLDCAEYVRSADGAAVVEALRSVAGQARIEEFRPGMEPTERYFETLCRENKTRYFTTRGANEYVGAGWTPMSIARAFANSRVRALEIGHPDEASLTPAPAEH